MSLQFILGPAGSGKSERMYRDLTREAAGHMDRQYFVIVPEQFNQQTQRELVACSPNGGILNIDIYSFPRLAGRVFEETGTDPGQVLTETGKNMILRHCVGEIQDELVVMGGRLDRAGYITRLKSALSEFAQYNIDEPQLLQMIDLAADRPLLRDKLRDMLTVSRAFDRYRTDRMITAEEVLKVFADVIPRSQLLAGSTVVFDGFTGFTPVQMLVMDQMLKCAGSVRIALDMDPAAGLPPLKKRHDLFALSAQTVHGLSRLAADADVEILESVILDRSLRYGSHETLARLERRLMRYDTRPTNRVGGITDSSLTLYVMPDPYSETLHAADLIWQLTREEGYRYRDIALITADPDTYNNQIERVFEAYGIPCFVDTKRAIKTNSAVEMICAALRMVEERFSYESVFHFLRCGYTDLTEAQIDRMENYVLALGIRSADRWMTPWTRTFSQMDEQETALCEEARASLMSVVAPFYECCKESKGLVSEYTQAVRQLCASLQLTQKLELRSTFEDDDVHCSVGMLERPPHLKRRIVMEYAQIESALEQILDETELLLGGETVSRSEFLRILEAGFDEAHVGAVPPTLDQVQVGDLVRSRLGRIRVLLFLGANDTVIPSRESPGGIMTSAERRFLADHDVVLAPDEQSNGFIQRFYLYQCLTKPSERLMISYAQSDRAGAVLRPSYLIYHLQNIFPGLSVTDGSAAVSLQSQHSPQLLARLLADRMRRASAAGACDDQTLELLRQYLTSPDYAHLAEVVGTSVSGQKPAPALSVQTAARLYGDTLRLSVSRIETFAQCPFRFYAQYGLHLRERENMQIHAADNGSFLHEVMHLFADSVSASGPDAWMHLSDEQAAYLLERSIQKTLSDDQGKKNLFGDSARNQYTVTRLYRTLERSVWALLRQVRAGELIPTCFEMNFHDEILQPEGNILLTGTIDRIDLALSQDEAVVKVVDYKSSARKISLSGLVYGDSLQLTEYLYQALAQLGRIYPGRTLTPAGVLYAPMINPVPETGRDAVQFTSAALDEDVFLRKVRPEGMVNADDRILHMLDHHLDAGSTSSVIPVALKKDGTPRASSGTPSTVTAAQLKKAAEYTDRKIRRFARQIRSGDISVSPLRRSASDHACRFCPYADTCRFDPRLDGAQFRPASKVSAQQFWTLADRELEQGQQ